MKFARRLQTKNGFSLAETMIGLAVATVVILGVAQSFDLLARGKQSIEMGSAATEWTQELRQAMRASECKTTLAGKTFPSVVGGSTSLSSVSIGAKMYAVGAELKPGMILKDVQLIRNGAGASTNFKSGSTNVAALNYVGILRIQVEKPATSLGGAQIQPAYIPVRVTTDVSNQVLDCAGVTDMNESTCSDLNFVWDAVAGKCLYRLGQCQYAGSYVSATYNGWPGNATGGFQNPFTSDYSCPADYEARLAGSFNKAESCGKGCVRNLLAPVYECVKCYDAAGTLIHPGATAAMTYVPADIVADADIDESTASVDTALATAVSQLQSSWVTSAAACYPSGKVFSGSTCNTSGGGYTQSVSATMCCSGSVKVCRNGFSFSMTGEPATVYYIPNYMGCN